MKVDAIDVKHPICTSVGFSSIYKGGVRFTPRLDDISITFMSLDELGAISDVTC